MRTFTASISLIFLVTLSISATAQVDTNRQGSDSESTRSSYSSALRSRSTDRLDIKLPAKRVPDNASNDGASPEMTQAEKQMRTEEDFQSRMLIVSDVITGLEIRARNLRKEVSAPSPQETDRLSQDVSLIDDELQRLNPMELSPLAQVQWTEQSERIFNLKLALEVMAQRRDTGRNVFGLSFFKSAPPITSIDQRAVPENYRLRNGDKIKVTVLSKLGAQDERAAVVDNSGSVSVPGLGKITAAGKTTAQLEKVLAQKIQSKFSQLRVQVTVASMATIQVQVSGEVARPGTYVLSGLATVFNVLYSAGGPTASGSFRKLYLVRDKEPKRAIDLYDFFLNGSKKQDLPLRDGDLVFVPPVGPTVTVSGEVVRPGRYEPGFPTTIGAMLKMAGEAKSGGYLQAVQVERVVDNQYMVLLSQPITPGNGTSSFAIQPGDSITITSVKPDKTNQVSIVGPVKAPGLYGFQEKMRMSDLIKLAQGISPSKEVYGGRADILRVDPTKGTSIISVNLDKALSGEPVDNIVLNKLDRVFIYEPDQVVFRPKLVTISGAVARPGTYKRSGGMKVSDAIAAAGGVLPDAHLQRADLIRLDSQEKTTLVRVDLQGALNGDPAANADLQDRDRLMIYTYDEVKWRSGKIRIEGAVQRPGTYVRSEGMRLSDLLFAAGGLLPEAATSLDLARCDRSSSAIKRISLTNQLPSLSDDVVLADSDVVTVPEVNPSLRSPEVIYLSGEVANPGPYVLASQNEKLADVLARAGGLTRFADVNGLLFLRRKNTVEKPQQELDSEIILQKTRMFADKQFLTQLAKSGVAMPSNFLQSGNKTVEELSKPTDLPKEIDPTRKVDTTVAPADSANDATDGEPAFNRSLSDSTQPDTAMGEAVTDTEVHKTLYGKTDRSAAQDYVPSERIDYALQNKEDAEPVEEASRISVNLSAALKDYTCPDNMVLRDGDRIFVPKVTNVVTVVGAVLHPHSFAAGAGKDAGYYIERSGGYSQEAAKSEVVVVRSNGDAIPMRRIKSVMPGDTIVVPTTGLIDIAKRWEKAGSVTKVISDVLSSVYVLTRF